MQVQNGQLCTVIGNHRSLVCNISRAIEVIGLNAIWTDWLKGCPRFLLYCVGVTKSPPYLYHSQNKKRATANEVSRLQETPCDAYTNYPESHYTVVLEMYCCLSNIFHYTVLVTFLQYGFIWFPTYLLDLVVIRCYRCIAHYDMGKHRGDPISFGRWWHTHHRNPWSKFQNARAKETGSAWPGACGKSQQAAQGEKTPCTGKSLCVNKWVSGFNIGQGWQEVYDSFLQVDIHAMSNMPKLRTNTHIIGSKPTLKDV